MFGSRIPDEVQEHFFDNWTEEKLQLMADEEYCTIPELKQKLLEFAYFFDFKTLDDFLEGHGVRANHSFQLDGAGGDSNIFDMNPQTPTMTPPMSQKSDDSEAVFDRGASCFTTPASQYTPAKLRVAENGSPMKHGNTKSPQFMWQADGGSSDLAEPSDCDCLPIDGKDQPLARLFDPEKSLKHRVIPMNLLMAYNHDKNIVHLQGVDPDTGSLQPDPHTLVITIDGVVYDDQEGQAGAAVFFHPLSLWNTVTSVEKTKDNAKLEALYIALNMIGIAAANDPNLKSVLIMCAGRDFCLANTTAEYSPGDHEAVGKWIQGADETTFEEVNELWTDITEGNNGIRGIDVRLWCVPDEVIRPVTELAMDYLYEKNGRDWYAENGKTRDSFTVEKPRTLTYQPDYSIVAPPSVVNQGPQAILKWIAEAKARLHQSILHKTVASDACRHLNAELRSSEESLRTEKFLDAYALATKYVSEDPQKDIDQFVAEQHTIRQINLLQGQHETNGSIDGVENGEARGEDEKLAQQVLEMDWDMDWE